MDHPTPISEKVNESHCCRLRHKGMFVFSIPDPDEAKFCGHYDSTAYWCVHTQKAVGPDGMRVHADDCKAGRECCEH